MARKQSEFAGQNVAQPYLLRTKPNRETNQRTREVPHLHEQLRSVGCSDLSGITVRRMGSTRTTPQLSPFSIHLITSAYSDRCSNSVCTELSPWHFACGGIFPKHPSSGRGPRGRRVRSGASTTHTAPFLASPLDTVS
jgi:hypothetical protein